MFAELCKRPRCLGCRDANRFVLYHRPEWTQAALSHCLPCQQSGQLRHHHESNVGKPALSDVPTEEVGCVSPWHDYGDRRETAPGLTFGDQALEARLRLCDRFEVYG